MFSFFEESLGFWVVWGVKGVRALTDLGTSLRFWLDLDFDCQRIFRNSFLGLCCRVFGLVSLDCLAVLIFWAMREHMNVCTGNVLRLSTRSVLPFEYVLRSAENEGCDMGFGLVWPTVQLQRRRVFVDELQTSSIKQRLSTDCILTGRFL